MPPGMRERYRRDLTRLTAFPWRSFIAVPGVTVWGPDFRDALILFDGRELRAGSVEIHLRTRGWGDHGHHLDPAYDTVVLHLVGQHDGTETRRLNGAIVPVVVIGPVDRFAVRSSPLGTGRPCRRRHLRQPRSRPPARIQCARPSIISGMSALPLVPPGSKVAYRRSRR